MLSPFEIADKIFESQNIQTFIFKEPYDEIERFDNGLRREFFTQEDYGKISRWLFSHCTDKNNIYLLEDFFRLATIILPFQNTTDKAMSFFVAGPFLFEPFTKDKIDDLKTLVREAGNNEENSEIPQPLIDFYMELPNAGMNRDRFMSLITALFPALLGSNGQDAPLKLSYHYFAKAQSYLYTDENTDGIAENTIQNIEKRYKIEHEMHESVRNGDEQQAISFYKQLAQSGIKPRSPNSVRNIKNFLIVLNSHLRKIMEQSGVHIFYVDEVSRNFAIQIEECTTHAQLTDLSVLMIKSYCQQIREHRVNGFSEAIKKCLTYIDFHYTEYISLQSVAEAIHLNPSYLSAQFAKETGNTLTAHINLTRINHALPLLTQSTRTIEDIASTVGFDDMNYFARVFKKIMGISPTAYRRKNR